MRTINEVKSLAAQKGTTLTGIAEFLSERTNKKYSINNLSNKLRADTIRYSEMKIIAETLGMKLVFVDDEQ